jgi:protein-S-isoprenylcysteine O-methyltransferase Ste14
MHIGQAHMDAHDARAASGGELRTERRDTPGVIAPPPAIYAAALATGFGLEALLPSASLPGLRWPLGGALLLAGLALAASFFSAFRRARTPIDVRRPTTSLVTTGPYRLTRNPGYLSLALIYAGIAVVTGALWTLALLVPALVLVDRGVIRREERYLEAKFGDEYRRYKRRARRWL